MDIDLGPLSDLTPLGVLTLTALVTAVDVGLAYILSGVQGKFDPSFAAAWLMSHSVKRVLPIYTLLLFGVGITPAGIPPVPALFGMAVVGVGAYVTETLKSVLVNFADAKAVKDETSMPPTDTPPPPPTS